MSQIFIQGQNFTWNTGDFFAKKPANHDLHTFRRTKTPRWSGEPNDLKSCAWRTEFFFRQPDTLFWHNQESNGICRWSVLLFLFYFILFIFFWGGGGYRHINGVNARKTISISMVLMQEKCHVNSIANALELHLSCTNPSIWECRTNWG